jgi:hypothetical protein
LYPPHAFVNPPDNPEVDKLMQRSLAKRLEGLDRMHKVRAVIAVRPEAGELVRADSCVATSVVAEDVDPRQPFARNRTAGMKGAA